MNETDVREDIAAPLLQMLGYSTGTANDIIRERKLEYAREFLGRKKNTDPPLRGRADYILTVLGAGSWVLEVKAEDVEIDRNAIEQAITYARHLEVAGTYAAILNGNRFVAFHNTQRSDDAPLVDVSFANVVELASTIAGTFSPKAIRHDCSPPKVDLMAPLASGLRSHAKIVSASILYDHFVWRSNIAVPREAAAILTEQCRRMSGLRVSAIGGILRRDEQSRIVARLQWAFPNEHLKKFAERNQIAEMEYICLSSTLSDDPTKPSIFHVTGQLRVVAGEHLFNMAAWKVVIAKLDALIAYGGQAVGFLEAGVFRGTVEAKYEISFPEVPGLRVRQLGTGTLELTIERWSSNNSELR